MEPIPIISYALGALESRFSPTYRHNNHTADSVYAGVCMEDLPKKIDLRALYGSKVPVRDQKRDGACVAFAVNVVAQQLEIQDTSKLNENLAPRFTYLLRENPETEGMFIHDAVRIIETIGVVREKIVPYEDPRFKTKEDIPEKAFQEAKEHQMGVAAQVWTLDALKKGIDQRKAGAVITFKVYNFGMNFWKQERPDQQYQGNHCVAIVGYDDDKKKLIIQNSWGDKWGDRGYTYYPYDDFLKNRHIEVWTFVDQPGSKPFEDEKPVEPPAPLRKQNSCAIL